MPVSTHCSSPFTLTLAAESPVNEAIHMILGERKPVIVVDDGRALGILVSVDLVEALNQ